METDDLKVMNYVDCSKCNDIVEEIEDDGPEDMEQEVEENPSEEEQIQTLFEYPKSWKNKEVMSIEDILKYQALSFLPAKSLCRFKSVCKDWQHWISNPFLVHLQSQHFREISGVFCQAPETKPCFISLDRRAYGVPSQDLNFISRPVSVRAVSNGLLCCSNRFGHGSEDRTDYYVCNPANKQWKLLPEPNYYHGEDAAVALAFEPSPLAFAARFHLVCAFPLTDVPVILFEVYSSETKSWRASQTVCYDLDGQRPRGDGFIFNGVVFWETGAGSVLAFNLRNDEYGMVPLPPNNGFQGTLATMRGELCYVRPSREGEAKFVVEVFGHWNMSLKYKIDLNLGGLAFDGQELRALACVNDHVLMLLVGLKVCAYDVKKGKLKAIGSFVRKNIGYMKFMPYVNSLISLG